MGKLSIQQKENRYLVTNKLLHPEAINEREVKGILDGIIKNIIPVHVETRRKEILLRSSVENMISLQNYYNGIVTKKMFLDTVLQIIELINECEKNKMNPGNLALNMNYIFVEPRTKRIGCIFWPIVNNQNYILPIEFLKDLPFNIIFNKYEDNNYIREYIKYFREESAYSTTKLERFILELSGVCRDQSKFPSGATGFNNLNTKEKNMGHEKGYTGGIAYNPLQNTVDGNDNQYRFCENCRGQYLTGDKFCSKCGNILIEEESGLRIGDSRNIDTDVLCAPQINGGTTLLGAYEEEMNQNPYLIREKTREKITINKSRFRIGKEKQLVDLFIADNSAISRRHADLISDKGQYFIIDLNSTNKTYIDNRIIPSQKRFEIFSGSKIRLANEDFTFYI